MSAEAVWAHELADYAPEDSPLERGESALTNLWTVTLGDKLRGGLGSVRRHEGQSTTSSRLEVKMSGETYTIGELSGQTGVAASALRYYEELGLLPPAPRVSGQRRYGEPAVGMVGTIVLLREIGFSLAEIKTFVSSQGRGRDDWHDLARSKLAELDERISRAEAARGALQHALRCRHEDVRECPNFAGVLAATLAGQPIERAHAR
jgi:DNA-binding transcriptional MerR regulator